MCVKNNFISSQYYSSCDLINKYNLRSSYNTPKIKTITVEISLSDFLNKIENESLSTINLNNQIKFFCFFFLFCFNTSFIKKCKFINKVTKNKNNETLSNYILKIIFSNKTQINLFLISFFIENWKKKNKNAVLLNLDQFSKSVNIDNIFGGLTNFKMSYSASFYYEFNLLVKKLWPNMNTNEFNIYFNFLYTSNFSHLNANVLKNLPFFWLSSTN
jgi:hypothetical protein